MGVDTLRKTFTACSMLACVQVGCYKGTCSSKVIMETGTEEYAGITQCVHTPTAMDLSKVNLSKSDCCCVAGRRSQAL